MQKELARWHPPISERMLPFESIPFQSTPSIYVAEIKNGWVKIGWTQWPRTRMKDLFWDFRRSLGSCLGRYEIFYGAGGKSVEDICLAAMRADCFPQALRKEYFVGEFDQAKAVVARTLETIQPSETRAHPMNIGIELALTAYKPKKGKK